MALPECLTAFGQRKPGESEGWAWPRWQPRRCLARALPTGAWVHADPDAVDSFATSAGPLHIWTTAAGTGEFALYDGTVVSRTDSTVRCEAGSVFDGAATFELIG